MNRRSRNALRLVSVVIPVRNAEKTLGDQLRSLTRQTYAGPWEVVVADNGSRDGSVEVARRFVEQLPHLIVARASARRGANHARNAGAETARGDFIVYCDADDVCDPGWLEELVKMAPDFDMVQGDMDFGHFDESAVPSRLQMPNKTVALRLNFLPGGCGANCAIWRDVLQTLGGWDEAYTYGATETALFWKAQLAGYSVGVASEALVHRRHRITMRGFVTQQYMREMNRVRLYRDFRSYGVPRSNSRKALRRWVGLVVKAIPALLSRTKRDVWIQTAARRGGRLVGSVRFRVLYL